MRRFAFLKLGTVLLTILFLVGTTLPALACYGAAAMGMGGAYTSLATGVLAIYWNQAGLAFTEELGEASVTVTTPEDYTNYNSFLGAAVKPNERLGLGFGQTKLAPWAGNETWNTFAAGVRLNDQWAVGGAYREIAGVDPETPNRYRSSGFDLSAQYRSGMVNLGLLVQDVGGPSESNIYRQNIRPSISLETDKLTLAIDIYDASQLKYALGSEYGDNAHQVGLEYRPFGKEGSLALRAGFYHDMPYDPPIAFVHHDVLTLGAGVKVENGFADLAVIPEWMVVQVTAGVRF
ncbi:MAG: hypothetical protein QME79_07475 [Bacillota bacterium]|nr:hypothetical protein [Bacillota bacterium]